MDQEQYRALEGAFIDGFREARDKQGFFSLARIPLELPQSGGPGLKLMQVVIEEVYEVGRASPGFASHELVYHPLPGKLISTEARLRFRYVSTDTLRELSLSEVLARSSTNPNRHDHGAHEHPHNHQHHHHD
jgi:hypothetical protein